MENRDRSVGDIDRSVGCSKGKLEMGGRKWIRNGRGREKE